MVDSRENKRTPQPQITQTNYIESIEELNKMDIFVCGTCYFVAHFVEEFISHKEMPCVRRDVIQPNTSDQKPQVWSFLLWKNAKHRANTQNSSWQLYQEWCSLPESTKDAWIEAGQFLKISSTMKNAGGNLRRFNADGISLDEEELSSTKATIPNNPTANSNKVMKKTRSGKYVEVIVERILAKRITNKRTEYWVKYRGRSTSDELKHWEPIESMSATCQDMISSFESKTYLGQDASGRKRTLSQTGSELNSAGLLNNVVGNKQKMEHVKQWIQDDTSGRIHGDDDDVAKKKLRTDGLDIDNTEDYEDFFLRQKGGIILRATMKSCPKSTHSEGVTKKKNLAAEIGLESEEEEEEGGKENIFGRKNVPAVLKPHEQKVLVVNSQGVVALDPVEIPNLSSGIYIMTNKNEETANKSGGEAPVANKPTKKPLNESGGYVILNEHERTVKDTNNEALGRVTSHGHGSTIPPKMPNLTAFKSGALTITPSVRNISKDVTANNIIRRQTPITQSQTLQSQSMQQKILGPKNTKSYGLDVNTTPKTRQVQYASRSQPQITYLNSSGETTNKRILGSVNRYKATPDKQQINHTEIHYAPSQTSKTVIKQEPQSNLLIPASGYQLDNAGVTDTVMIKVEMSPGGTNQYVRGISGLESPQYTGSGGQVSGLKVKRIESPRKRNSTVRDSAHISILNRKDLAGGSALAVPARKLKMFRNEEEEAEEANAVLPVTSAPSQPQGQEEMVTIAGEDGTLYQVASSELNGSAVLLTTGEDGQQQCLYVTDENGQPTILQGATIDGQEMLLDQAVYNEATGTIQMFQDQSGMETQVYQQDENGQLMPVDNPDEVLAQVQAAQQQEELLQQQQQQEQELAALAQQQDLGQQQQELTPEQAAEFLQQQQQADGAAVSLDEQQQQGEMSQQEHVDGMQVAAEGADQQGDSEVVAQLVEASEPSADGGPRKVVLLLSDGNLIQTEMSEEQFAALENS